MWQRHKAQNGERGEDMDDQRPGLESDPRSDASAKVKDSPPASVEVVVGAAISVVCPNEFIF